MLKNNELSEIGVVLSYHGYDFSIEDDILFLKASKGIIFQALLITIFIALICIFAFNVRSVIYYLFLVSFISFLIILLSKKPRNFAFIDYKKQTVAIKDEPKVISFDEIEKVFLRRKQIIGGDGEVNIRHDILLKLRNKTKLVVMIEISDNGKWDYHFKQLEEPFKNIFKVEVEFADH